MGYLANGDYHLAGEMSSHTTILLTFTCFVFCVAVFVAAATGNKIEEASKD
jgi:hypothetical protein